MSANLQIYQNLCPPDQVFIIYSRERVCLTAHIPCTNALRQVTPVNYCILTDLINASSWITELLISDDRLYH